MPLIDSYEHEVDFESWQENLEEIWHTFIGEKKPQKREWIYHNGGMNISWLVHLCMAILGSSDVNIVRKTKLHEFIEW